MTKTVTGAVTLVSPAVAPAVPARQSDRSPVEAAPETRGSRVSTWRRIGETDLTVHPVGLNAGWFGSRCETDTAHAVLDRYTELGGNTVVTSDGFAEGRSEAIIGAWLRAGSRRDGLVLASRIGHGTGPDPDRSGGPRAIVRAVEASLRRLGTDRLDLLSLYAGDAPLDETLAAADVLIASGKVRHLSASGFPAEYLFAARILVSHGFPAFCAVEARYNLLERSGVEGDLAMTAAAQGVSILPTVPLAHGFLAGIVRTRRDARGIARGSLAAGYLGRRGLRVLGAVDAIADEIGTTRAAVALAWLLTRSQVVAPVVSAGSVDHVDAVMPAATVRLTRSQLAALERASV